MKRHLALLKNNRSGFTFVELLVVIVIMAVLIAASANYLFSQGGSKARDTERKNEIKQVAALVEQFVASYGEPPNPTVKNRKIRGKITECDAVADYEMLMTCFQVLKYADGEGLLALAEDPKQGITHDTSGNMYEYLYGADNNGWKLCAFLENQTDPDLNDDYSGSGTYGSEEGNRTYCVVASNRKLSDIAPVAGNMGEDGVTELENSMQ
ncbi:prepilin-type N-terminal cleavage/methylation domain-containing protein [Patescibacteria group bacterium]|nr:prepilin-type N-terminal cleavage/methylation domain-containing protein [Patescibacteria group bacterium]MBU1682789.1 prepilin-type N-terminal cleavage/methylation domain-containing protein [Patescibacteria group bacterium]MBU1935373.1 prepilin-type N-terminal cleavage/methylation domain-containing protein [Patescibacteria group bacterium]